MSGGYEDELDPGLAPEEHRELARLAASLERERPVPVAAFRGDLRRHLLSSRRQPASPAPCFRLWAASYATLGVICLVVAAIGLAGAGPFAT